LFNIVAMSGAHIIAARVSSEMKQRVQTLAEQQLITESIWLRRLVAAALNGSAEGSASDGHFASRHAMRPTHVLADDGEHPSARVSIRLRPDDRLLLRERASARGLASATYVSVLVRAHLRHLAPLPKDELKALKRLTAELTAIGRNLNQLARVANQGSRVGLTQENVGLFLKLCEALRDAVKKLVQRNVESWEVGHGRTED
jgi:Bacterial mobilisation protein (MobC)